MFRLGLGWWEALFRGVYGLLLFSLCFGLVWFCLVGGGWSLSLCSGFAASVCCFVVVCLVWMVRGGVGFC